MVRPATRINEGVKERRCGHVTHRGARWIAETEEGFFFSGGKASRYCRECQRRDMRTRYRSANPDVKRRLPGRPVTRIAFDNLLDRLTSGWGR